MSNIETEDRVSSRDKLFEDTIGVLKFLNPENRRELCRLLVVEHPELLAEIEKDLSKVRKKIAKQSLDKS